MADDAPLSVTDLFENFRANQSPFGLKRGFHVVMDFLSCEDATPCRLLDQLGISREPSDDATAGVPKIATIQSLDVELCRTGFLADPLNGVLVDADRFSHGLHNLRTLEGAFRRWSAIRVDAVQKGWATVVYIRAKGNKAHDGFLAQKSSIDDPSLDILSGFPEDGSHWLVTRDALLDRWNTRVWSRNPHYHLVLLCDFEGSEIWAESLPDDLPFMCTIAGPDPRSGALAIASNVVPDSFHHLKKDYIVYRTRPCMPSRAHRKL